MKIPLELRSWRSSNNGPSLGEQITPFLVLEDDDTALPFESRKRTTPLTLFEKSLRRVSWLVIALLPTFLYNRFNPHPQAAKKIHSTAWLDGVRGYAALFVFFFHYCYAYHTQVDYGYGFDPESGSNWNVVQLPIIRLFYSGPAMVSIFFIVSGYSLSIKPLKLLRGRSWDGLLGALCSSAFRRYIRLFFPTFASTLIVLVMVRMGLYESTQFYAFNGPPGVKEQHPAMWPSLWEQLQHWYDATEQANWLFTFEHGGNVYDIHLWTIPIEYRCSLVLFLTILMLAKARTAVRITGLAFVIFYTLISDLWEISLFLMGLVIAEINLIQSRPPLSAADSLLNPDSEKTLRFRSIWGIQFFISLYILSAPALEPESTPGYTWTIYLAPPSMNIENLFRINQAIGASLFIWTVSNARFLSKIFSTRFAQYLGKISYSLYLVHGPICHTLGYTIVPKMLEYAGEETGLQYETGFFLASLIVIPVVFWAADLFERIVDMPCVEFSKWFEQKCTIPAQVVTR
jgi:peptidoglycan/LPS O-acetylase OafA/YrhL